MEFRSFREVREYYFPSRCEKERIEHMGSEEYAKHLAEELADKFKFYLEN